MGNWSRERLVIGSVPINGSGCILKPEKLIKQLAKLEVGEFSPKKAKKKKTKRVIEEKSEVDVSDIKLESD